MAIRVVPLFDGADEFPANRLEESQRCSEVEVVAEDIIGGGVADNLAFPGFREKLALELERGVVFAAKSEGLYLRRVCFH